MKKFLIKNVLHLFLLTSLVAAPNAYAQSRAALTGASGKALQTADERRERVNFQAFNRTELFFGRNKPDGTEVTEEEFSDFLSETITPEFPDGLTVLDGIGQFRGADGKIIREKAKVLILLYPQNTQRANSRKIERIREAYKARFAQESVLRVDEHLPSCAAF